MKIVFAYKDNDGYHITADRDVVEAIIERLQNTANQAVQGKKYDSALELLQCRQTLKELVDKETEE